MKKIAVFPGSFDPFTKAHEDLVNRATQLFDHIYIAIGVNSAKKGLMSFEERQLAIENLFASNNQISVGSYTGLTVDYCRQVEANYIVRGLRNSADFEFENIIAQNNLLLAPDIQTYFLVSQSGLSHISSTIVRDILLHGGDVQYLIPEAIYNYIKSSQF